VHSAVAMLPDHKQCPNDCCSKRLTALRLMVVYVESRVDDIAAPLSTSVHKAVVPCVWGIATSKAEVCDDQKNYYEYKCDVSPPPCDIFDSQEQSMRLSMMFAMNVKMTDGGVGGVSLDGESKKKNGLLVEI
jgi:hypothetical protein